MAIILQLSGYNVDPSVAGAKIEEVAGYVCLRMPNAETGPFRGEVVKLMVSIRFRKIGVARRVMAKLVCQPHFRSFAISHSLYVSASSDIRIFK